MPVAVLGQADFVSTSATYGAWDLQFNGDALFVTERASNSVLVYANASALTGAVMAPSYSISGFYGITKLAVYDNTLYVADGNGINVISPIPTASGPASIAFTIAYSSPASANGPYSYINGMTAGPRGLYVSDGANRVLVFGCASASSSNAVQLSSLSAKSRARTTATSFASQDRPLLAVPNPSSGKITAWYWLETPGHARLRLFDLTGSEVLSKDLGQVRGQGSSSLDLGAFASGVYLLVLDADAGDGYSVKAKFKLAVLK